MKNMVKVLFTLIGATALVGFMFVITALVFVIPSMIVLLGIDWGFGTDYFSWKPVCGLAIALSGIHMIFAESKSK